MALNISKKFFKVCTRACGLQFSSFPKIKEQSEEMNKKEEWLNSLTHLIGALLALGGFVVLETKAALDGNATKIIAFAVYGTTLLMLYIISTIYHWSSGPAKRVFRALDYYSIYLLIAGTYTPFTLVTLGGVWGWSVFGIVWGLAVLGIVLELIGTDKRRIVPVVIYLLMGWLIIIALKPLLATLPMWGFVWLLVGGLCYSGGIVFYALDERFAKFHAIWHLFVMAGSLAHYFTILLFVL